MDEARQAVKTRMSSEHFAKLEEQHAWICFACRAVSTYALPGNARDNRERVCPLRSCREEACMPVAQARAEGWIEVVP